MKEEFEDIVPFQPQCYFRSSDGWIIVYVDVSSVSITDFYSPDEPIRIYRDSSNQYSPINQIIGRTFEKA